VSSVLKVKFAIVSCSFVETSHHLAGKMYFRFWVWTNCIAKFLNHWSFLSHLQVVVSIREHHYIFLVYQPSVSWDHWPHFSVCVFSLGQLPVGDGESSSKVPVVVRGLTQWSRQPLPTQTGRLSEPLYKLHSFKLSARFPLCTRVVLHVFILFFSETYETQQLVELVSDKNITPVQVASCFCICLFANVTLED